MHIIHGRKNDWLQNMYETIVCLWGRCENVHVYRLGTCMPMYVYEEKSLKKNPGMFKVQDQNSIQLQESSVSFSYFHINFPYLCNTFKIFICYWFVCFPGALFL